MRRKDKIFSNERGVAEMQKKNNFKSRVNPRKDKQMPVREPYLYVTSVKNSMAPNLVFLAKTSATGVGGQDSMARTITLGNH